MEMETSLIILLIAFLIFVIGLYIIFEVNYYVRGMCHVLAAKIWKKKLGLLESSEVKGIVLPSDGDFYFTHMNNARCFREFDFGRLDNFIRNGLFDLCKDGGAIVAAHCLRYRKPIWMFSVYKIVTTPVYWDTKFVYVEQKIITISDDIIRCIGYVKIANNSIGEKIQREYPDVVKPDPPEDLEKWMDYNDFNSRKINGIKKSLTVLQDI